jgi:large subunit ribosomal protein L35
MPKLKTHSGTKDRIRVTKHGKLLRRHSASNHFLQKKRTSTKRTFTIDEEVSGKQRKNLKRKMGL